MCCAACSRNDRESCARTLCPRARCPVPASAGLIVTGVRCPVRVSAGLMVTAGRPGGPQPNTS